MKLEEIKKYKISESEVLSDDDVKHIANYKQLIKFFENAIQASISDSKVNYTSLHSSCIQCIRFLDNLILTYENTIQSARHTNSIIDKIIEDNKKESLGNADQQNL